MRLTAMITMSVLLGTTAHAKERAERVTVYVSYGAAVSMMLMAQAQGLASQMFAGWRENLVAWTNSRAMPKGCDWNRISDTHSCQPAFGRAGVYPAV
jgi:hypothetical protein